MISKNEAPVHVLRWFNLIKTEKVVVEALKKLPEDVKLTLAPSNSASRSSVEKTRAQEGKFVDLPGAEIGKVVVRFPPEASG